MVAISFFCSEERVSLEGSGAHGGHGGRCAVTRKGPEEYDCNYGWDYSLYNGRIVVGRGGEVNGGWQTAGWVLPSRVVGNRISLM